MEGHGGASMETVPYSRQRGPENKTGATDLSVAPVWAYGIQRLPSYSTINLTTGR